jgi:hypothetical protein
MVLPPGELFDHRGMLIDLMVLFLDSIAYVLFMDEC